jgi:uncharacterized protein (TIGR03067 family)
MDAVIQCRQCGVKYVGQASLQGEVFCPRCGALASGSRPPVPALSPDSASSPVKSLYRRVVCTACLARLIPPRLVAAGQPIQCPKCQTIFAAPGALQGGAERAQDQERPDDDGWETAPDPVILSRRVPEPKLTEVDRPSRRTERDADDGQDPPISVRVVRSGWERQKRDQSLWLAVTLGSVGGLGLLGIVLLLILARPNSPASGGSASATAGRQRIDDDSSAKSVAEAALRSPLHEQLRDRTALQGEWQVIEAEVSGERLPADQVIDEPFSFSAGKMIFLGKEATYELDATVNPRRIDIRGRESWRVGIYKLEKDRLTICVGRPDDPPKQFKTRPGAEETLLILKRRV